MNDQNEHGPDIGKRDWDGELLVHPAIPHRQTEVWRWNGHHLLPVSSQAVAVAQNLEAQRRFRQWKRQAPDLAGRVSHAFPVRRRCWKPWMRERSKS